MGIAFHSGASKSDAHTDVIYFYHEEHEGVEERMLCFLKLIVNCFSFMFFMVIKILTKESSERIGSDHAKI